MYPRFVLFGALIIQFSHDQTGFALAPALQHLYSRKLDVVTRGFFGYNTDQAVVLLKHVLESETANPEPTLLLNIFVGSNDAAFSETQRVPVERCRANISKMVKMAQAQGIKVVVTGPALHDTELFAKAIGHSEPFSSSRETRKYADVIKQVAQEHSVPFIDLWLAFQKYGGWLKDELLDGRVGFSELLIDGIHFTPTGYKIYYDELVKAINTAYPELAPSALPQMFPNHDEIDNTDIEGCLAMANKNRHGDRGDRKGE